MYPRDCGFKLARDLRGPTTRLVYLPMYIQVCWGYKKKADKVIQEEDFGKVTFWITVKVLGRIKGRRGSPKELQSDD